MPFDPMTAVNKDIVALSRNAIPQFVARRVIPIGAMGKRPPCATVTLVPHKFGTLPQTTVAAALVLPVVIAFNFASSFVKKQKSKPVAVSRPITTTLAGHVIPMLVPRRPLHRPACPFTTHYPFIAIVLIAIFAKPTWVIPNFQISVNSGSLLFFDLFYQRYIPSKGLFGTI